MLHFFFKKNFYDGWDNVLFFFIPNLILDAILLAFGGIAFLVTKMPESMSLYGVLIWTFCIFAVIIIASIFALTWSEIASEIVNYGLPEAKDFFKKIKSCIKDGILYGLTLAITGIVSIIGTIYYFKPQQQTKSFIGLLGGSVFVWIALTIFMGLFWYPAMRSLLHNYYKKSIKKCFIILFDNLGTCVILGLYNILLFLISIVMLGLAPGLAGIGLSRENALFLLLKKYDYLDELDKQKVPLNDKSRRRIPWKEILKEDIEATGTKTFKSFFMPWKELEEQGVKAPPKKKHDPAEDEIDDKWKEEE